MQRSLVEFNKIGTQRLPNEFHSQTFKGMYASHKYWSKKPGNIIRQYILAFTNPNEIVLDPFAGYGVTMFESLAAGRLAVGVDINPASVRIIKGLVLFCNIHQLEIVFNNWLKTLENIRIRWFTTKCENNHTAHRTHTLFKDDKIDLIKYKCDICNKTGEKKPDDSDINNWKESLNTIIDENRYPLFIQNTRISARKGMRVSSLFTKRSFYLIEKAFDRISEIKSPYKEQIYNIFTAAIPQASKMVFVISRRRNTKKRYEVGSWVAGFWQPKHFWEISPVLCFQNRFKKYIKGKIESNNRLPKISKITTKWNQLSLNHPLLVKGSATELNFIPDNSVDYILTDPPHGDRVPYLEYSQLWNSFFHDKIDWKNEIVVSNRTENNSKREKYKILLTKSMKISSQKLKTNRFFTVFFQNLDFDYWNTLISSLLREKMVLVRIDSIPISAGSVVQDTRKNGLLADIALTFKKEERPRDTISLDKNKSIANKIALEAINNSNRDYFKTHHALEWILTAFINNKCIDPSFNLVKLLDENYTFKKGNWYK